MLRYAQHDVEKVRILCFAQYNGKNECRVFVSSERQESKKSRTTARIQNSLVYYTSLKMAKREGAFCCYTYQE